MGIDAHNLALLAHAADLGVSYARTIGVGRQVVFVDPPQLERVRAWRGHPPLPDAAASPRYFEPLMHGWFGASTVDSVDASPYEGATRIHDLNLPWPEPVAEADRYDAVLDFGCLEHVFDFPTAWRNVVQLCRVGGHVLHALPANNLCGHGFYQFSPELFWNLYREPNGFAVLGMWMATKSDLAHWWRVADPRALHRRVNLANAAQTYLMVVARKERDVAAFATPQQSDYAEGEWQQPSPTVAETVEPAAHAQRGAAAVTLDALGLLDATRTWRDAWRAVRPATAWPSPDYTRVDVALLLARRGGRA